MSGEPIELRMSRPDDADAILAFIAAMGFTPRDRVTWDGLEMSAALAIRGSEIVGAIPIEMRPVKIGPNLTVQWAHQTCVAVHPDLRGGGLGRRLQRLLRANLPEGTQMMGVYREDPESPAYKWYLQNGFRKAISVVSWTMHVPDGRRLEPATPCESVGAAWIGAKPDGCVVDQRTRPLDGWLHTHPYRSRYRFERVDAENGDGYAVIGFGQLHSSTMRADILDFVVHASGAPRLLHRCLARASELKAEPLRWALSEHDPLTALATRRRMKPGWRFDLLVQPVDPAIDFDSSHWRYASIDFI